jgi:type VI secretion system protein ImpA
VDATPEFVDLFQQLDGMVNAFDAEGAGPLRKGEQPFSWAAVETLALPLAEVTPDLRVGIWLLRAEMAREGLPGLARGMARLAAWMQLPADQLHPLAEVDEPSRELHALLLAWLSTPAFLGAVRDASIWREAPFTITGVFESQDLGEGLAACPLGEIVAALTEAAASAQLVDKVLLLEASAADVSLSALRDILSGALGRISAFASPQAEQAGSAECDAVAVPAMPRSRGIVNCRDDARDTLEQLIQYFLQQEPGHPAPIFLRRVERMLGASFENLMQELFPDASQLVAKLERPLPN